MTVMLLIIGFNVDLVVGATGARTISQVFTSKSARVKVQKVFGIKHDTIIVQPG